MNFSPEVHLLKVHRIFIMAEKLSMSDRKDKKKHFQSEENSI